MSLFKNEVGRPSNETKRKRRFIIVGGIAFAIVFLFAAFTFIFRSSNNFSSYELTDAASIKISKIAILPKGLTKAYLRINGNIYCDGERNKETCSKL